MLSSNRAITQFVTICESYENTPFHHKGRAPGLGLDCVGLPLCAAWAMGIQMEDNLDYGHEPSSKFLRHMIADVNGLISRPLDDDQAGDILLMRYSKHPTHIAIRTFDGIVHAYAPMRRVVKMPLSDSINHLIVGRFRYPWQS